MEGMEDHLFCPGSIDMLEWIKECFSPLINGCWNKLFSTVVLTSQSKFVHGLFLNKLGIPEKMLRVESYFNDFGLEASL